MAPPLVFAKAIDDPEQLVGDGEGGISKHLSFPYAVNI
jgi:hypothetical protein